MSFTSAALASELNTDPATIGYAPNVAANAYGALAAQINAIGAGAAYQVPREPIPSSMFTALIDLTEFSAATQAQRDYLRMIVSSPTVDINNSVIYAALNGLFTTSAWPNTRNHFAGILKRQGSRAEVLWGVGTTVSDSDIGIALHGVG